ncbi:hypothetical protein LTR53_015963, partial [Teratosphaeriaceae sp. CCFEE 6253]
GQLFNPYSYANPLPEWTPDLTVPAWTTHPHHHHSMAYGSAAPPAPGYDGYGNLAFDPNNQAYPFPGMQDQNMQQQDPNGNGSNSNQWMNEYWSMDTGVFGNGLNLDQQHELMRELETGGMEDIQSMISRSAPALVPKPAPGLQQQQASTF